MLHWGQYCVQSSEVARLLHAGFALAAVQSERPILFAIAKASMLHEDCCCIPEFEVAALLMIVCTPAVAKL